MPLIWTGQSYEDIPNIAASDLQYTPAYEYGSSDSPQTQRANWGFSNYQDALGKYGNLAGMNSLSHNWQTSYDPSNPDTFSLLTKSGDKEGTRINFSRQGDQFVPQVQGTEGWNTSPTAMDYMPYAIMAAPFAAAAMGAGAAGGGGLLGGEGISMLPASNLFEGATLAANAPTSLAAGAGGALGGLSFAPASNVFEGATMAPGAPTSIAGAGGSTGLLNSAKGIAEKIGPSNLLKAGSLVGGMLGGGAAGSQQEAPAAPVTPPSMWGGNPAMPQFQGQGNTETERRMNKYLPSLFSLMGR
jgi:hypothetical protein